MKTPIEKAIDYCMEVEGQIHQPYIDAFIAGYQAANEWISVEDELPENETYINLKLKNGDLTSIFYETRSDLIMLKRDCTHWKPIN